MPQCSTCVELWRYFEQPDGGSQSINLGSFDEALASECPDHPRMIEAFRTHRMSSSDPPGWEPDDVGFVRGETGHTTKLYESVEKFGLFWSLTAVKREDVRSHPGNGRILDPDWIDLDHAREWKRECLSSHAAKCENPMKLSPVAPAWLIDVEKKCIVSGDQGKAYVALSYRWNDTSAYRLHQAAISDLRKEGGLDGPEVWPHIPLKIRHAMWLTAAMGEQYLWADALCIDHDDKTSTSEQVNLMTAIYAGALFTIIAADGDPEGGIRGLKGISQARKLDQKVFPIGSEQLIVRNTDTFSITHFHDYHKRGWTYQEFTMSPRKLIFLKDEVHWLCNCCVWHEDLTLGAELDKYIDPRPEVLSSGFPDLCSLSNMLCNYNNRNLTYDADALAAISGLLTVFSRSFEGGFLYGLPEVLFDRALAWEPQWPFTELRKRNPTATWSQIRFAATDLPSWSWLGWHGMFSWRYGEPARINDREHVWREVTPITEWYTSSSPKGQPLRRIRSTWFEERTHRKNVNQPMPPGWMRLVAPNTVERGDEQMFYPDGCGKYVYQHHAFPDNECPTWYYPFQVPEIETSTPYCIPEQTRYLFCKTWKVSVWSHRAPGRYYEENNKILTLRRDVNEAKIGTLHLQTDEQLALWPESGEKDETEMGTLAEVGRRIELVAINECVRYSKTFDKERQRYDHPVQREELTTVLWVEWENGVAYRLACGDVNRGAWQSLNAEPIDLVLG